MIYVRIFTIETRLLKIAFAATTAACFSLHAPFFLLLSFSSAATINLIQRKNFGQRDTML
jgi:hypothetical protein